jgi:hypothetical protein
MASRMKTSRSCLGEMMRRVPAIALLDFFRSRLNGDGNEAMGSVKLHIEAALDELIL